METTSTQILKELASVKEILESITPADTLPEDISYIKDSLTTRIIHITGHIEKMNRVGII